MSAEARSKEMQSDARNALARLSHLVTSENDGDVITYTMCARKSRWLFTRCMCDYP